MLKMNNFTVKYPDKTVAVDNFHLNLEDGEKIALIGANGAGKTSLIMALVGVLEGSGEVILDDMIVDKNNMAEVRRKIGVVFQNPDDQLFMSSIFDDIAFGLRNAGMDEEKIEEEVDKCLETLGITHLKNRTALKLSGGEKRMAAIATVLVMKPSMIIFDEPTAFLDPKARRGLIKTIKELDKSMIIATHDMTFAAETCQRTVLIKEGKVFADGRSKEILMDEALMDDCGVEAISVYERGY